MNAQPTADAWVGAHMKGRAVRRDAVLGSDDLWPRRADGTYATIWEGGFYRSDPASRPAPKCVSVVITKLERGYYLHDGTWVSRDFRDQTTGFPNIEFNTTAVEAQRRKEDFMRRWKNVLERRTKPPPYNPVTHDDMEWLFEYLRKKTPF